MDEAAEWLEADGQGGFASGTAGLFRTRRYHALLLTARQPPSDRVVLVNAVEAWVETPAGRFPLSSARYAPDTTYPRAAVAGFDPAPWPRWRFELPDGTVVHHEIFVSRATTETVLRWQADRPVRLSVRPMLSGRDYHATHHENPVFDFTTRRIGEAVTWQPYPGLPAVTARGDFTWKDDPDWFRRFLLTAERDRGLDDLEDLASPGHFTWDGVTAASLVLRADALGILPPDALATAERARRTRPAEDSYLATRGDGLTILAGFPWFTDWGRDTFIALRGLLIVPGRLDEAAAILRAWAPHVSEGMLPNRFPDGAGPPEYNAVDASLWFVVAAYELMQASGRDEPALRAACFAILDGYTAGTRFGIGADPADGLLRAGAPGTQLTWMDAKHGDHVFTPRIGKPVEVQALWFNALSAASTWPDGTRWAEPAAQVRAEILRRFPDPATGGLADVVDADGVAGRTDRSVRPNQVLAAGGLPFPLLPPDLAAGVVALAERELLTPLGLRTLSPADPAYRGRYAGGPAERDGAYHQGTAWPWLLGPFVAAWLAVHGPEAREAGRARFLPPLEAHLREAGLGHVSEVVDGDAPHIPGGCPFQAWSLGEFLRIRSLLGDDHG